MMNDSLSKEGLSVGVEKMSTEFVEGIDGYSASYFLAVAITVLYITWWVVSILERQKLPPGPPRLPIIGSLLFHGATPPDIVKLKERYGDIFTLFIGHVPFVILGSKQRIKEALDTKGDHFSDRGEGWLTRQFTGNKKGGFSGSDYTPKFRETRSNALAILNTLGFGRTKMEKGIRAELEILAQTFTEKSSQVYDPFKLIMISMFNNLYSVLVGERVGFESERALKGTDSIEKTYDNEIGLLELWSFMRFVPKFGKEVKSVMSSYDVTKQDIREQIHKHIKSHSPGKHTDFLHAYLDKHIDSKSDTFDADIENLHQLVIDILLNGVEFSARSIQWLFILMTNYPEIQKKAQEEIDRVVGTDKTITMADKGDLNYIQALIWEVQRFKPILPNGLPHCARKDSTLGGYHIPKGTTFSAMATCMYWDSKVWGDPMVFRPERFLDESGKFVNHPEFIPFSVGKRTCFGEVMARQILFLYTATLLQKFQVVPPPGMDKVSEEGHFGFTFMPPPTQLQVVAR